MARRRVLISILELGLLVLLLPPAARANNESSHAQARLGTVSFPTSCSAEVQPLIEKGVSLLHSFQYQEAHQTFAEVEAHDRKCAMAHWGKAMTLYHQLWDIPDAKTLSEGATEIEHANKLHPATPQELGFLIAASAFYRSDPRMSYIERAKAYSTALERLHAQFPADVEVSAFYALSLVALAGQNVDASTNLKNAIAILDPLLRQYPDHPGVAHYLIHAADKPELAPQGLAAARRYAAIAPDSPHALHMPSHIFVRLGMWQDSILSNIAATASAAHAAELHKAEPHYQTHAMDFLNYSYLQCGQEAKAREVIEQANHVVGASEEERADQRAYLAARTALELHHWTEAAALQNPHIRKEWQDTTQWARAIGAARGGDLVGAQSAVRELKESIAERQMRLQKKGNSDSTDTPTNLHEGEAWLSFAQGKTEDALQRLRGVADHEEKTGDNSVNIPAREMLADMLLELKRPAEALREYRIVLKNAPKRFDALLGAARAAQASGDAGGAQAFYEKLIEVCPPGADRPELMEAKALITKCTIRTL